MTSAPPTDRLRRAGLELLERLGSGSSGTVYRARRLGGDPTPVAVKVLLPERLDDPRAIAQLRREGELGMAVDDPHVARIMAVETLGAEGGEPPLTYLLMQLVEGRTLRELLADSAPVVEDLARRIGLDAATGLAALHQLGVVHRDVKPENLALTPAGEVVVMDLGLARASGARGSSSSSSGFFGSLAYAAPEVLSGQPATAASDLYALGLVLFEVVTGRHPFGDAKDADDMMHAQLHREPPPASHLQPRVSAFLERLIADLLAKAPERRPASAAAVATALRDGELSEYWREHERTEPILWSRQQLRSLRRFAPTPMVGRRAERRQLDQLARRVAGGRGAAMQITGPFGIGRRRLVDEALERWLRWRPDLVLLGGQAARQAEHARGAPFPGMLQQWFLRGDAPDSPLAESRLRQRIRSETDLSDRDSARLAALIAGSEAGDSPETRADLLARGLLAIAARHFTVLRVERAERLSTTGRLVVELLVDRLADRRLLLILVTGGGPGGWRAQARRLALEGLDEDRFVELAEHLFEPDVCPRDAVRRAHAMLGGNPGHLLEALEDLRQQGLLAGRPGRYHDLAPGTELRPPEPELTRLAAQIESLPPAQGFVLKAAAVLGDRCRLDDLLALTGDTELEALEALSVLGDRVVLAERGRVLFRHRDYRRAVLDLIPLGTRRRLHRNAAWILDTQGAPPLQVGLHLSRAGEHAAAVEPLLGALAELTRGGSGRAAVRVAERLRVHIGALPTTPDVQRLRLRRLLLGGLAQRQAHRPGRARRAFERAYRLALRLGDRVARAQALVGAARLEVGANHQLAALHLLGRAEQLARGADAGVAASALGLHVRILCDLGDTDQALPLVREALDTLPHDDLEQRPHLRVELAKLEALRNHFVSALKNLDRAERGFLRADDKRGLVRVALHRGRILLELGDLDAAGLGLEDAYQRAQALHDARHGARALLALGQLAEQRGDEAAAKVLYVDALAATKDDPVTRAHARLRLDVLGIGAAHLDAEVTGLEVPALQVEWLLERATRRHREDDPEGAAADVHRASALERAATLPLGLRLHTLHASGRHRRAEQLVADVAQRLPPGPMRRQLQAQARRIERTWLAQS